MAGRDLASLAIFAAYRRVEPGGKAALVAQYIWCICGCVLFAGPPGRLIAHSLGRAFSCPFRSEPHSGPRSDAVAFYLPLCDGRAVVADRDGQFRIACHARVAV